MPKLRVVRHEVTQPLDQSYRLIPLTQGKNAIVDAEDFEWLSQWNWYAAKRSNWYAARLHSKKKNRAILMHTALCGFEQTDHINGDGLDNRKANLRPCTHSQNSCNKKMRSDNTTGFKGVHFIGSHGRTKKEWQALICINGKPIHIGVFTSAEEAARARDKKAKELHGQFARLNFGG